MNSKPDGDEVRLREFIEPLRDQWWIVPTASLVGGLVALMISSATTPLYRAETQFFVSTREATSTAEVFQGGQFSRERVASYARLLSGEEVASRVVDRLGLETTALELADSVDATAVADTVLIDMAITDSSPERAQRIAEAFGAEFPQFIEELESPVDGVSLVDVTVTDRPEVPDKPALPRTPLNVALGVLAGLLMGIGIALLRARLDRTVKDVKVTTPGGAPVIGTVLKDASIETRHVADWVNPSRSAEDFRQLRTSLRYLSVDEPPRVMVVSSAMPAEGKTTVVVNLALALAEGGQTVAVVDADLRRPRLSRYLGLVENVGLTNVLAGTAELPEVGQRIANGGVTVVGSGPLPPNPSELLASRQMSAVIEELRSTSDYVLIDAPPLLPVADALGLAVVADGVLLSLRYGRSRKDQLHQAANALERVGARTLGLVLSEVPARGDAARGYGYSYAESEPADVPNRRRHRRQKL
ncbi:polysaccharide biosynthesis tyrosine autokinase [Blastococcus sp. SYSU DS1024]